MTFYEITFYNPGSSGIFLCYTMGISRMNNLLKKRYRILDTSEILEYPPVS